MAYLVGATQSQISKWESGSLDISPLRAKDLWDWIKLYTAPYQTVIKMERGRT